MSSKDKKDRFQKNLKKLNKFFDTKNASLSSRFKSLISYVERASNEELNKFFNENFYMIYGVFLDTFSAYESSCKKGKHSNSEVQDLMTVLKNVLIHLAELVRKRWQIRSIASVLEKVLYKENRHNIRMFGFELLLYFLEAVGTPDDGQVDVFGAALDLEVFQSEYRGLKLKTKVLQAPDKTSILVPANATAAVEHTVQMLEILLEFMGNRPDNFEFWFELLKTNYIIAFYPEVSKTLGILAEHEESGFKPSCPQEIQAVLISRLEQWMRNDKIVHILWSSPQNEAIMLEIYRQSCYLPISCDATIKKSIGVFRNLFLTEHPAKEIKPKLVEFRKFFLQKLSIVFKTETSQALVFKHVSLCLEILQLFKYLFVEAYETLEVVTQEVLLYTLLETTTSLLKPNTPNAALAENLAAVIIDTVLFIWIRTKTRTEALWQALQEGISGLFHFLEPVIQTKIKLLQLTLLIKDTFYPIRSIPKKTPKKTPDGKKKKLMPESKSPDYLPPLPTIKRDLAICDMSWSVEEITYVWNQMLLIFNKVNHIKDPTIHCEAIKCLDEIIQILLRAEDAVPFQESLDGNRPLPLCLINIFGPWLFQACDLPDKYIKGKAEAYGVLCRMIVRHSVRKEPLQLLSHFYATIHQGLTKNPNSIVSWTILENSSNIFNLAIPGVNVLIPYYLAECQKVLDSSSSSVPSEVKTRAITILSSLICYPNHWPGLETGSLKLDRLTGLISKALRGFLNNSSATSDQKMMCLFSLSVLIYQQLYCSSKASITTIKDIVNEFIKFATDKSYVVYRAALDSLSLLAYAYDKIKEIDMGLVQLIVEKLCLNIVKEIKDARHSGALSENTVSTHFFCLMDWCMIPSDYIFDDTKIGSVVCQALELGILGQKLEVRSSMSFSSNPELVIQKESKKEKKKRLSVRENQQVLQQQQEAEREKRSPLCELYHRLKTSPVHGSPMIKEAAEALLLLLTHYMQNYPCSRGIDVFSSQITEADDQLEEKEHTVHYVLNDFILISATQVPGAEEGTADVRLILRDFVGKFAWDTSMLYNFPLEAPIDPPCNLRLADKPATPDYVEPEAPAYKRDSKTAPVFKASSDFSQVDQLEQLLNYLTANCEDCLLYGKEGLNQPAPTVDNFADGVTEAQTKLLDQDKEDKGRISNIENNKPSSEHWMINPPPPAIPSSHYHLCRLLLSQLGFTLLDKNTDFCVLENSARFHRSLGQLDKTSGREMLKIGVIYVKQGQDTQREILHNDTQSDLYSEFIRGLGYMVDVATHRGYLGGLDPKLTTGTHCPYWATSTMEVVFHDVTSMPTNPSDEQQIHKKRHVGNDIVHIVYSEHMRDYITTTIQSQFNNAHVVVYPLPNGLFRIQIFKKDNVPFFGPLLHGMALSKEILPFLVRATAINANRYVRYGTEGYTRPFPTRARSLAELVQRYKIEKPYESKMTEVITGVPVLS